MPRLNVENWTLTNDDNTSPLRTDLKTYKRIWLKIWPKLLVTASGVVCYVAAAYFPENHRGLVENISANLISIPLIFLIYDVWNDKSHQKLYENVYQYAGNEMSLVMADTKQEMLALLYGFSVYLDGKPLLIDDTNMPAMKIVMRSDAHISYDDDGEAFLAGDDSNWLYDMDAADDPYALDKATIVPVISETFYLGFQLRTFRVSKVVERLDDLIRNAFVMEKMDDKEATIIVELHRSLRMLQSFLEFHDDLFLPTGLDVEGFKALTDRVPTPSYYVVDLVVQLRDPEGGEYLETLDSCMLSADCLEGLVASYVDYYVLFSDLIHEVIDCIGRWKKEAGHGGYLDFEQAKIGVL